MKGVDDMPGRPRMTYKRVMALVELAKALGDAIDHAMPRHTRLGSIESDADWAWHEAEDAVILASIELDELAELVRKKADRAEGIDRLNNPELQPHGELGDPETPIG